MRGGCLIGLAAALAAGGSWSQTFKLVPAPRSITPGRGELVLPSVVHIAAAQDREAAELLAEDLRTYCGRKALIGPEGILRLLRAGDPNADRALGDLPMDRTALEHPEGYVLHIGTRRAVLAARTAAGVFYGVQTLRQLLQPDGRLPAVTIGDWPALPYRGLSVDVSRGPVLNDEQMRELVRTAAEFKLNLLSFYMEHVFDYDHAPLVAPEGARITADQMRRLADYARRYHIELVPQQQTFGHLHHMLKLERYQVLAEVPHGSVLTPEEPATYEWIERACRQLADAFPGRFLHIGSDETWELGEGRSRPRAEREGVGEVYVAHLRRVHQMLRPLNRRVMFWGDIALRHAELIPKLPRELVAMSWVYSPAADYSSYIEPFRRAGMDVFVCPGLNNWNRVMPNFSDALANINRLVRDGKRLGAIGMLNTHWADDGEALLNQNWYGILFSAAAAWQPGEVDVADFHGSFDWVFYREPDPTCATVINRLEQVHSLLRKAGLGDASNRLFWFDPFSEAGARRRAQLSPIASELRLLAEEALVELERARARIRHRAPTLRYLELAARRLDYLGMKVQFSERILSHYREALSVQDDPARVRRLLNRISSTNGLLQDLREALLDLKARYREAWLAENRPYWLENVLVRYDAEALKWQQMIRAFTDAAEQYAQLKRLPEPERVGLGALR